MPAAILAEDEDSAFGGEIVEAAGQRESIENGRAIPELVPARCFDLAENRYLEAVHFVNDHRHFRRRDVLGQHLT